jgi:hypothetical protein
MASTRARRWLLVTAALLLVLVAAVYWVSRPQRVSSLVLGQLGSALGLEITAEGASEYRLRGGPRLVLRDVAAREPGSKTPLLRAKRIDVAVPWSTVRSRGATLSITHVEIDAPVLDLPALQRWLAARPEGEQRTITLTDGLRVRDGRVVADGWSVEDVALDLPRVLPDRAVDAELSGHFLAATTRVPFDLQVALTKPANTAGLSAHGTVALQQPERRLVSRVRLSGPLHFGDDGVRIAPLRLSMSARLTQDTLDIPFALALNGPLRIKGSAVSLSPVGIALRGEDVVPNIDGRAAFAYTNAPALHLEGVLATWPDAWPTLPPPIGQSTSPLPFALDYAGPFDLSAIARLQLQRDETRFDGRFCLPDVLAWVDAKQGSPIPPMSGRIVTPQLDIAGATLEGVDVRIEESALEASNAPSAP